MNRQEFITAFLNLLPTEKVLGRFSAEERMEGVSPEEVLAGLSLEDRLKGLCPEELDRLRKLLQQ